MSNAGNAISRMDQINTINDPILSIEYIRPPSVLITTFKTQRTDCSSFQQIHLFLLNVHLSNTSQLWFNLGLRKPGANLKRLEDLFGVKQKAYIWETTEHTGFNFDPDCIIYEITSSDYINHKYHSLGFKKKISISEPQPGLF